MRLCNFSDSHLLIWFLQLFRNYVILDWESESLNSLLSSKMFWYLTCRYPEIGLTRSPFSKKQKLFAFPLAIILLPHDRNVLYLLFWGFLMPFNPSQITQHLSSISEYLKVFCFWCCLFNWDSKKACLVPWGLSCSQHGLCMVKALGSEEFYFTAFKPLLYKTTTKHMTYVLSSAEYVYFY